MRLPNSAFAYFFYISYGVTMCSILTIRHGGMVFVALGMGKVV
jgi:hypothetical protein